MNMTAIERLALTYMEASCLLLKRKRLVIDGMHPLPTEEEKSKFLASVIREIHITVSGAELYGHWLDVHAEMRLFGAICRYVLSAKRLILRSK